MVDRTTAFHHLYPALREMLDTATVLSGRTCNLDAELAVFDRWSNGCYGGHKKGEELGEVHYGTR